MKSAYHIARDWVQSRRDAPSSFTVSKPFGALWKKLWAACVPLKVKIGVWKVALDIIPIHDNLRRGESRPNRTVFCAVLTVSPYASYEELLFRQMHVARISNGLPTHPFSILIYPRLPGELGCRPQFPYIRDVPHDSLGYLDCKE